MYKITSFHSFNKRLLSSNQASVVITMKCNALVIAITLLGTLGKVPLVEASTCANCNAEKTVKDCDGICMEGTDFCNICVK